MESGHSMRISGIEVVAALVRRRRLIGISTLAACAAAVAFSGICLLLPPTINPRPNRYTARAAVQLVSTSSDRTALQSFVSSLAGSGAADARFALALLSENTLVDEVTSRFDFAARYRLRRRSKTAARRLFRTAMSAHYVSSTGIIELDYTDTDPQFAAEVLSYSLTALSERFDGLSAGRADSEAARLDVELHGARRALEESQTALVRFQRDHHLLDPAMQFGAELDQLDALQSELIDYRLQTASMELSGRSSSDADLTNARREEAAAQTVLESLRIGPASGGFMPVTQIPEHQVEYAALKANLAMSRSLYSSLRRQYELTRLQAVRGTAFLQVIDAPEVPETPSGPNRTRFVVLITLGVFLLTSLIALFSRPGARRARGQSS